MKKCYSGSTGRGKPDRKTVERNRRIQMKGLCINLISLIPPHHFQPSKEVLSQVDQLDQAASYIKQLRERIEKLKKRKEELVVGMSSEGSSSSNISMGSRSRRSSSSRHRLPMVELRDLGSSIEVVLISGLQKNFMLCEVIGILQEEGADVVSASYCTVANKVFHTFHAQVKVSRVGVEISRIQERLQDLISL